MKLADFSIKNSSLMNLFTLLVIAFGIYSIFTMQRDVYPRFSFDLVTISTAYPGATPEEIERLVTIPIEKEIKQVDDLDDIFSASTEGLSVITLKLNEDAKNKDKVITDIQRAVDQVPDLPSDLPNLPVVKEIKTQDMPIIQASLWGQLPEAEIRKLAKELEKELLDNNKIARVDKQGFRDQEIWVEMNAPKLNDLSLSLDDIARALAQKNKAIPGGKLSINNEEFLLRTTSDFTTLDDVKNTIVRSSNLGPSLVLSDIATITPEFEERNILSKARGNNSINLIIAKKSTADTIKAVKDIKEIVTRFKERHPNVNVDLINDASFYVVRRQGVLFNNGIMGLIMVALVLFIFLSKRVALSACIGIPTALCLSFGIMKLMGISINLISMFGLIMVIGMLVDEDIIISENIYRHLVMHDDPKEATVRGVSEVAKALIVTVLTTIVAFFPLWIVSGIMGKFISSIPTVVTITLGASLVQALMVLPSHMYEFNKNHNLKDTKNDKERWINKMMDKVSYKYGKVIEHAISHRYKYLSGLFITLLFSYYFAFTQMKFILFPAKGIESFIIQAEAPLGNSLDSTAEKFKPIEALINQLPNSELESFTTTIGLMQNDPDDPQAKRGPNVGQIDVFLTPDTARTRTANEIADEIREKIIGTQGFESLSVNMRRAGPPVGKAVQIRVRGDSFTTLEDISQKIQNELKLYNGVLDIGDDLNLDKNEYHVVLDPLKISQNALSVETVARYVRMAYDGFEATSIKSSDDEIKVRVKLNQNAKQDPQSLLQLRIPNTRGELIYLSQIASFEKQKGFSVIKHYQGTRAVNITANVDENLITPLKVEEKIRSKLNELRRNNPELLIDFGGEVEETQESMHDLFAALAVACALIGIILIATFNSYFQTFAIMLLIPLSLIGVIWAFFLHNEPFSFMAMMGVIGITGVVVDGATLVIDHINKLRDDGLHPITSIITGSTTRFRAIFLTTLTHFVGIIPAAYGLGGEDPFINPMALALNWGIIFGATLSLGFIPLALACQEDLKNLAKRFKRKQPELHSQ